MGVAGFERAGSRINAGDRNSLEQKAYPTVYLNIAEFGDGVFGVEAAANVISTNPRANLPGRKLHYWRCIT